MEQEEIFTIDELASFLKIPKSTTYYYIRQGILRGHKIGRRWRFLKSEILEQLKNLEGRDATAKAEPSQEVSDAYTEASTPDL